MRQSIANPGLGEQPARPRRIGFKLRAQLLHIDAQVLRLLRASRPPYLLQQSAMSHHQADMLRQHLEQSIFDRGQVQLASAFIARAARLQIDLPDTDRKRGAGGARAGGMAQRDLHPGAELTGSERLGDVVVGAGLQSRDLVRLVTARRQHDDRHPRPAAYAGDHLGAVAIGQSQIDDQQIGFVRARFRQSAFRALGFDDAEVLQLEQRAQHATQLRLVLDHQHRTARDRHRDDSNSDDTRSSAVAGAIAGNGSVKRSAAPCGARFSAHMRPLCRARIVRQIASPRPMPPTAPSGAPRWNFSNRISGSAAARPGPSSSMLTSTWRDSTCALMRISLPAGVYLPALSSRFSSTCSIRRPSMRSSGDESGSSMRTPWPRTRCCRRCMTEPTSSSSAYRSKRGWMAPVSSRTRSSSVVMRSLMRVASSLTELAIAPRSASLNTSRLPASVAAPAAMVASGVRRSCEIDASRALRIASVSARTSAAWAWAAKSARSNASPIWAANVSSKRNCSGRVTRRGFSGSNASTPNARSPPASGR